MKSKLKKLIPFNIGKKLRGYWQQLQSMIYYGKNYDCPFCNNSFRKMLDGGFDLPVIKKKKIIGAGRRSNCVCPRCYSTDRDRLIYYYLKNHTSIFKDNLKVIHIAPSGSLKALLTTLNNLDYQEGAKYHDGFYYSKDIAIIDITKLSFEDNTYDVILCNHVLEHIIDDHLAISELYRILKPGGWAILQVPISMILDETYENAEIIEIQDREKHFGQFDHVRIYGKDYTSKLEKAGFKVEAISPYTQWNETNILDKYAVNKDETLFIAHK